MPTTVGTIGIMKRKLAQLPKNNESPARQEVQITVRLTLDLSTAAGKKEYAKWALDRISQTRPFGNALCKAEVTKVREEAEIYGNG